MLTRVLCRLESCGWIQFVTVKWCLIRQFCMFDSIATVFFSKYSTYWFSNYLNWIPKVHSRISIRRSKSVRRCCSWRSDRSTVTFPCIQVGTSKIFDFHYLQNSSSKISKIVFLLGRIFADISTCRCFRMASTYSSRCEEGTQIFV